jgi:hypothetical protein
MASVLRDFEIPHVQLLWMSISVGLKLNGVPTSARGVDG